MIAFASAAGAMLLVSLAIVLGPLWWGKQASSSRREANVAVYEQHVAELDRELAAAQITAAEAEARRNELDAQLLSNVDEGPTQRQYTSSRPWLASAIILAGFIAVAVGLYSLLGDTRGLEQQQQPDISALVAKMKTRLATVPDDLRTRALLGQVQMSRHNYAAAAETFEALNKRMQHPNVTYLTAEARARVLGNHGEVDARAHSLYTRVLSFDPDNIEALWFAGLAAVANGNKAQAAQYWQHLLAQDVPDDFRSTVKQRLAEVQGKTPRLRGADRP